ncbi:hypothetical protein AZI87_04735 [Bdellovibrio bacteriovorus]|uniref:Uncharacterized protein n=1 Tax=Bdellovibrio bacteriovorus TaxID=959 RepID=A0A162GN88_BDEBC|nr:hypothetical protein AZI87_04735 [Bdellovibrio bacteriovorus]
MGFAFAELAIGADWGISPFRDKSFKIQYDQIQEVTFSDLGMSLSMRLKNGKNISLGSTIRRESDEFFGSRIRPSRCLRQTWRKA